jgi:hypothetical protein
VARIAGGATFGVCACGEQRAVGDGSALALLLNGFCLAPKWGSSLWLVTW